MRIPRFLAWLYANLNGYFWLPCRICGENYGGFETGNEHWMLNESEGSSVCNKPECNRAAHEHNLLLRKNFP